MNSILFRYPHFDFTNISTKISENVTIFSPNNEECDACVGIKKELDT